MRWKGRIFSVFLFNRSLKVSLLVNICSLVMILHQHNNLVSSHNSLAALRVELESARKMISEVCEIIKKNKTNISQMILSLEEAQLLLGQCLYYDTILTLLITQVVMLEIKIMEMMMV